MIIPKKARISLVGIVITITWFGRISASGDGDVQNPMARGWGDSIEWVQLEQGIDLAKAQKKPLMLIIHKTWCGACQSLKAKFAKAKMIAELAKNFIMVNAEDDEEPWEEEYYPDGGKYIPRILFLSPEGEVKKDIVNPKDEFKQYPYYYSNPGPIIQVMQKVAQRYGSVNLKLTEGMDEDTARKEENSKKDKKRNEKDEKPAADAPEKQMAEEKKEEDKEKDAAEIQKAKANLPRKDASKDPESAGEKMEDAPKPPSHLPPKIDL